MSLRPSSSYNKCLSFSPIPSFELAVLRVQPEHAQASRELGCFAMEVFVHGRDCAEPWALVSI